MFQRFLTVFFAALLIFTGCSETADQKPIDPSKPAVELNQKDYDIVLEFPAERYPETAAHIQDAIKKGHSDICTIDRDRAEENREKSLKGIPTKEGFDRDEWPMAFCREGGKGAHVSYIDPSDNRGAGAWVSREVNGYKDGTRVKFVVKAEGKVPEEAVPLKGEQSEEADEETFEDKNCSDFKTQKEAKEYLLPGDPHRLDPDQDGIPCEHLPAR
ncbi:hypothetical protein GCM10007416_21100 [Kroppenstedtia guangzhouensis]|uniref:Excalibur calcium-binding domain-containing protein n=1 Tax=Kroppenstedtia guangzhouensis TaxID=1274356 RepID=A0ABQ1GP85_9BACL|nr:hypothetical protein GCM10007416_21100 [Kroppenstedtia guangzhouensis]